MATVSLATVNRNVELPPLVPSGWLTCHATAHSPFGSGIRDRHAERDAVGSHRGVPTATGEPLHTTSTTLVAPSGLANVSSSEVGDVSTVVPAAGDEETNVLSTAAACGTAKAPTATTPAIAIEGGDRRRGWA